MSNVFTKDKQNVKSFYEKNMDEIKGIFSKNSKLFNIEFDSKELSLILDQYCGLDYFLLSNKKVYGVAGRVNFNKYHHNHVTIRYKRKTGALTEFQKRIASIKNKSSEIYANITMQIDAVDNKIKRAIIFESDKLYMHIHNNLNLFENQYMLRNNFDGNLFFKINYLDIKRLSDKELFKVYIYKN